MGYVCLVLFRKISYDLLFVTHIYHLLVISISLLAKSFLYFAARHDTISTPAYYIAAVSRMTQALYLFVILQMLVAYKLLFLLYVCIEE